MEECVAFVIDDIPGLAVTHQGRSGIMDEVEDIPAASEGWTVTHLDSGYSIGDRTTFRNALQLARELQDLEVDWTEEGDSIVALFPANTPGREVLDEALKRLAPAAEPEKKTPTKRTKHARPA